MHTIHARQVVLPDADRGLRVGPATLELDGSFVHAVHEDRLEGTRVEGLIAPAFVNPHTHLSMSAFRGVGGQAAMRGNVVEDLYFRLETALTADDVDAFTRMALAESLLAGVGTVWDHYYFGRTIADAAADMGMTAVIAPTLQDLEGPGVGQLDDQLAATLSIAHDAELRAAGVVAALGPHATDTVSPALFGQIADLAQAHQLPLHLHAAQSIEEVERAQSRYATSPIDWLQREGWLASAPTALLVHVLYANRADLDALDRERVALCFCPASQIQYCFPAFIEGWRELDHRIVVGTDCGACNDGMNVQQELRLAASGPLFGVTAHPDFKRFWNGEAPAATVASHREGLNRASEQTPADLLAMVTSTPGALHPGLPVGKIAPGYRANLVVYDVDHPCFWPGTDPLRALALQDVAPSIRRMMTNGRWLSNDREHQSTILTDPQLAEARERARHRLARYATW